VGQGARAFGGQQPDGGLQYPEQIQQYVSLSVPHPWFRFPPAMLRGAWWLWFMPVIATPGLGARLLGRGNQPLARSLLETDVAEHAFSAGDRQAFLRAAGSPSARGPGCCCTAG
jgi:hypothetical protein